MALGKGDSTNQLVLLVIINIKSVCEWYKREQTLIIINFAHYFTTKPLSFSNHPHAFWHHIQYYYPMDRIQSLLNHQKKWYIAAGSLLLLCATKLYFRGALCRVERDLNDKWIVVTGGNAGIGKETIYSLYHRGCTIIFGARDQTKSLKIVQSLQEKGKEQKIYYFPLDLSDKKSIEQFSRNVKSVTEKVDILINNAGIFPSATRKQTKDGFEFGMGVNHLGHFYLTYLLWQALKKAEKPRIINVSSQAHRGFFWKKFIGLPPTINFQDFNQIHDYRSDLSYSRSKLANILFTKMLQKKLDQANIQAYSYSLHPGVVFTDIISGQGGFAGKILFFAFRPLIYLFLKTPTEGAQTTLYLVLQNENKLQKGGYFYDCKARPTSKSVSQQAAQKLWSISEKSLGIKFDI